MGAIGSPQRKLAGKVSTPKVAQAGKFLEVVICGAGEQRGTSGEFVVYMASVNFLKKINFGHVGYVWGINKLALL
jgi:hypothetical protein